MPDYDQNQGPLPWTKRVWYWLWGAPAPRKNASLRTRYPTQSSSFVDNSTTTYLDINTTPTYQDNSNLTVTEISSQLERQADRYENAGDMAQADALRAAAEQALTAGSVEQAYDIAQLNDPMDWSTNTGDTSGSASFTENS